MGKASLTVLLAAAVVGASRAQVARGAAPFNGRLYAVALNGAPARTLRPQGRESCDACRASPL